jgi:SAM-dependent methyltransferase
VTAKPPDDDPLYTRAFYEQQSAGSRQSAAETIPLLLQWLRVSSVVDVGCGIGTWLAVFREHGVTDGLGLDGAYVDRTQLLMPASQFRAVDLTTPPRLERTFDLAVSIEVAEHLPAAAADSFVRYLTTLAPIVLFSAAVPGQGGTNHLNEQWPEYWATRFLEGGFVTIDCLRPLLWHRESVQWWHAQNMLVFVAQRSLGAHPLLQEMAARTDFHCLARVHPRAYAEARKEARELSEQLRPENMSARQLLRRLPTALLGAVRRRLR